MSEKLNQRIKVLNALKRARSSGVTNAQLNAICYRYGARLWELRHEFGYQIETIFISKGVYRFRIHPAAW